mmetsp:Transcript_53517/g.111701  ORF Transcript_53517/g.111701 Transcript_53517/m.111701 type:complete len:264 (-) Transcript_53517:145-936(-)
MAQWPITAEIHRQPPVSPMRRHTSAHGVVTGSMAHHIEPSATSASASRMRRTRRPRRRRRSPPAHTWPRQRKARPTASRSQRGSRRLSLRRIANEQLSKRGSTDESTGHIGHARGEGEGNVEKRASSTEAGSDGSTPRAKASSSRSASASRTSSTAASRPSPEFSSFEISFAARVIVARSNIESDFRSFRDSLAAWFRTTLLTGIDSVPKIRAALSRSQISGLSPCELKGPLTQLSVWRESKSIRPAISVSSKSSPRSHTVSG